MRVGSAGRAAAWCVAGWFAACGAGCYSDPTSEESGDVRPASVEATAKDDGSGGGSAEALPLKLLVVDDPPLARAIARQWEAMTGRKLEYREMTSAELAEHAGPLDVDLVVYPSGLLGTLAERRQIVPLPDEVVRSATLLRRGDQLEMVRLRETVWGETTLAVPLASSQFVLLYRRDLLEQAGAAPPESWGEYQTLVAKFAEKPAGDGAAASGRWSAAAEPLGPGWSGLVLLARAAAYARHRSQYSTTFDFSTLEPRLATPPFVRALEELAAVAKTGAADGRPRTPEEARRAILAGECALALAWPAPAPADAGEESAGGADAAKFADRIGVAPLPGSADVYNASLSKWEKRGADEPRRVSLVAASGRLGSVAASSRHARGAANFLAMLSASEWHEKVVTASRAAGMYRDSHVERAASWVDPVFPVSTAGEYGRLVRRIHREDLWMAAPRIPGRDDYLAALDEAVEAAVAGRAAPEAALGTASDRWQKITDERGRDAQKQAYRRCLGLEK